MLRLLHELLCHVRRPGQHSLEHPRPDQRPAAAFTAERSDPDLDGLEDVLAPPLVAFQRSITAPTASYPAVSRDGWPYNLRSA